MNAAAGMRGRPLEEKEGIVRDVEKHVWPLIEQGKVKPVIHCRLPLEEVQQAHKLMESSTHVGKILLFM